MVKQVLLPKRDIFADLLSLQLECSKDSLHLEHSRCKSSQIWKISQQKIPIVSSTTPA